MSKVREILEKVYCDGQVSGAGSVFFINNTNYECVEQALCDLAEIFEAEKKGKQGCVGFIEDGGEYNKAIDHIIWMLRQKTKGGEDD